MVGVGSHSCTFVHVISTFVVGCVRLGWFAALGGVVELECGEVFWFWFWLFWMRLGGDLGSDFGSV